MIGVRERALALSAAVVIPVALRCLPLRTVLALCDRWPALDAPGLSPHALAFRVRRWLAHGRGPWASTCLTRSLVLYAMLRQHGHRPRFTVGVAGPQAHFSAHAWVSIDDTALGDPHGVADGYAQLLSHHA